MINDHKLTVEVELVSNLVKFIHWLFVSERFMSRTLAS